ncbi:hypothetical protein ACNQFZ_09775 [Schinkia sp. CFF1]
MIQSPKLVLKETPAIRNLIKRYKKWFENVNIVPYAIFMNDAYYYYAIYVSFNKPVGYLIFQPNGELPSNKEAKQVLQYIDSYNGCIGIAADEIIKQKELTIWPFERKLILFELLKEELKLSLSAVQPEIDRICYVCEQYVLRQERLKQIYKEIEEIHNGSQIGRGYITVEDSEKVNQLVVKYKSIIYIAGRLTLNNVSDAKKVIEYLQTNKGKVSNKHSEELYELIKLLNSYTNVNTLEKAIVAFEKAPDGSRLRFEADEIGIQQMIENEQKNYEVIMKSLKQKVRNP